MLNFLIIDTYYPGFLAHFYAQNMPGDKSYGEHLSLLMEQAFGTADFYSNNLKKLGFEAHNIIFNDVNLQYKWAREVIPGFSGTRFLEGYPYFHRLINKAGFVPWKMQELYKILKAQVDYYKPDILYIQDIKTINDRFLSEIKGKVKLIVGQIASVIPENKDLKVYDLILTSFPHFVGRFRSMGIQAEYLKIAFESSIWDRISGENLQKKYDCTFIGGLTRHHAKRAQILGRLGRELKVDIWGYSKDGLSDAAAITNNYHGPAWGMDMYRILAQSRITINSHIDAAQDYANNMRLYESTGCGAMLITDYKNNLSQIFSIGKEVIAYKDPEELIQLTKYYLEHDNEREMIAKAGQKRTLAEHSYYNRMRELADILNRYLA